MYARDWPRQTECVDHSKAAGVEARTRGNKRRFPHNALELVDTPLSTSL